MDERLDKFIQNNSSDIVKLIKTYIGDVILTLKDFDDNITYIDINQEDVKDYRNADLVISIYCIKSIIITDNRIFERYYKIQSIYGKPAIIRNKDLSNLFKDSTIIDGNLNEWITTGVTNMSDMFCGSKWDKPLDKWDTSKVVNMYAMFFGSLYNHPLNNWDTSNVKNMGYMFPTSKFNHPLNKWDTSNVTSMNKMFYSSNFNHHIDMWDISSVTNMDYMFAWSKFNYPINNWDVSGVTEKLGMFNCSLYMYDIPHK